MRIGTFRTAVAVAFSLLLTMTSACGQKEPKFIDNRKPYKLNEVLTNEMSDTSSLKGLDDKVKRYMQEWRMQGAQLSIIKNDSLVYAKGYGWADKEKKVEMQPSHIMRLASVSKLVTATGIMIMQEQGLLSLKDTVFGDRGILCDSVYTKAIKDKNIFKITVEDLLRHKGGFSTSAGDPMFSTRTIMRQNHLKTPPDHETLTKIVLGRNLDFVPGTSQYYSNFGYLLLSMIIEKVSGETYEKWIQKNVLKPAHCNDFHIAENYYKNKYKNEVRYYVPSNEPTVSEYNNSGNSVVRCYGGNDIHALSGAGAWVASTPELARLVASIDVRRAVKDIVNRESIHQMVQYFDPDTYSLGWNDTDPEKGWKRTGTFSGTTALIMYDPDGECWIFASNTSTWKGPSHARYTGELFSELRRTYSDLLPKRDLFHEPTKEPVVLADDSKSKKLTPPMEKVYSMKEISIGKFDEGEKDQGKGKKRRKK